MSQLHIIRHGQTNWNVERRIQGQTDSILTEVGVRQAQQAGEHLKTLNFDAAYTSSSVRARDTAAAILAHHNLQAVELDQLREIFLAHWEGRLYEEMHCEDGDNHNAFWEDPSKFKVEGAETFYDLQQRAVETLTQLAEKHIGDTILVVSHGAYIKSFLSFIEGRHLKDFWQPPRMKNCCHSIVNFENGKFEIEQYGLAVAEE